MGARAGWTVGPVDLAYETESGPGTRRVRGYANSRMPGLAIADRAEVIRSNRSWHGFPRYAVTHQRSGHAVAYARTKPLAIAKMTALFPLANWTLPAAELRRLDIATKREILRIKSDEYAKAVAPAAAGGGS